MSKVWEPEPTTWTLDYPIGQEMSTHWHDDNGEVRDGKTITQDETVLTIEEDGVISLQSMVSDVSILFHLPKHIRLCRLTNAQPVQPTAQAFYDEWIRRYMDASKQRGDPYQIARDIAIELGIKETHDA